MAAPPWFATTTIYILMITVLEVRGVTRPPWTRGDERQQHPKKVATGRGRHRQRDGGGTALFDRHFKARNSTGTRQGRLRQLPTGTQ